MELKYTNIEFKEKTLSLEIPQNTILGLTGSSLDEIIPIIALKQLNKGQITIDKEKVTKDNIYEYRRKISIVDKTLKTHTHKVIDLMIDYIRSNNLSIKDPTKKIIDSLKIVDLNPSILDRYLNTLSTSEKKQIQLATSLLSNPNLIILNEPFKCLDKYNEKKVYMLLQRLKEQFKKTIIIVSTNSNILYKYTTNMIFIKNDEVFLTGNTNEVYLRVDYLKKNKFSLPAIVEFTHIAKKKKEVKIDYHKDVRDIIKDIYKHI